MEKNYLIEKFKLRDDGYKCVFQEDNWQVALIKWSKGKNEIVSFERHKETPEIFILLSGKAGLLTSNIDTDDFTMERMETETVYNVKKGVWHAVIVEGNVNIAIIEKKDTHLLDVEYRNLTLQEKIRIKEITENF
jgi:mannose-6-phosphate isomerase-like protein (cupin superfamily)